MTPRTNEKGASRPLTVVHQSMTPIAMTHLISLVSPEPIVREVAACIVARASRVPAVIKVRTGHDEMAKLDCNSQLSEHADDAGKERTKSQNCEGQLHDGNHDGRNQQRGQIAPHDLPVNDSAASRSDKRRENRENHCRHYRHEIRKYVIHDKRPRTQLVLTLRLIWRTGKLILDDVIRRGVNSFTSLISAISTVSRVRLTALTFAALLLAACASPHGDDACARSYSASGHTSHVGRSA